MVNVRGLVPVPDFGEIPSQLSKGPEETWDEYIASLFVTFGMFGSLIGIVLATLGFLGVQFASDILFTKIPFPRVGEVNLFLYLIAVGIVSVAPLVLQVRLVADDKLHLIDDAITTIIFNTIALILVVGQTPEGGLAPFFEAAGISFLLLWGGMLVLRIIGTRTARRVNR